MLTRLKWMKDNHGVCTGKSRATEKTHKGYTGSRVIFCYFIMAVQWGHNHQVQHNILGGIPNIILRENAFYFFCLFLSWNRSPDSDLLGLQLFSDLPQTLNFFPNRSGSCSILSRFAFFLLPPYISSWRLLYLFLRIAFRVYASFQSQFAISP